MFGQSGVLMLLGMAVVFLFLTKIIVTISVAGRVIHAVGWDKDAAEAARPQAVSTGTDGAAVAAITAAVKAYRTRQRV
jgi:oxaloacetate decarboxylase gamma subunit